MNLKNILGIVLSVMILSSCFKEDDKVIPHVQGSLLLDTIAMGQTYTQQVYFDLGTAQVVSSNRKDYWDLGFECSPEGWRLILNTANFMKASDAGELPFPQSLDTAGRTWSFDKSDGNPDSNAIGLWFRMQGGDTVSKNHIYIIDRGMDENGDPLGFRQLIIDSLVQGTYYFRIAWLDGANPAAFTLSKDPSRNYLFFSFRFGGQVQVFEPPREAYDLWFTQYTTLLFTNEGTPYPYLVTGVLLNPNKVKAALDTTSNFHAFSQQDALAMTFSSALDYIGYDWKYYNFDLASYTVVPGRFYVLSDTEGFYYKLRFIGFYNNLGQKGYPVMEFQRL